MNRSLALSLALFALIGAVLAAALGKPEPKSSADAAKLGLALPGLATQLNTLERFELADAEDTLRFVRVDQLWQFETYPELPINQAKVRETLLSLAAIKLVEVKTDKPKFHAALGLADEANRVKLGVKPGAQFGLLIGKATRQTDRFVRRLDAVSYTHLTLPTICSV